MSSKHVNKIISKIDRYFSWDNRTIINGHKASFIDFDRNAYVSIKKTPLGLWCYYSIERWNGEKLTWGEHLRNFHDINNFIRVIQALG